LGADLSSSLLMTTNALTSMGLRDEHGWTRLATAVAMPELPPAREAREAGDLVEVK
jgi:hypothetical protein